jgi:predicted nucleic acid-binding Zn ribbon protein
LKDWKGSTKTSEMTYSYKCQGKCKMVQDYVHGMNEDPTFTCCGKVMKKLFTKPMAIVGANTGGRKGM